MQFPASRSVMHSACRSGQFESLPKQRETGGVAAPRSFVAEEKRRGVSRSAKEINRAGIMQRASFDR